MTQRLALLSVSYRDCNSETVRFFNLNSQKVFNAQSDQLTNNFHVYLNTEFPKKQSKILQDAVENEEQGNRRAFRFMEKCE